MAPQSFATPEILDVAREEVHVLLPVNAVNVLLQVRRKFEDIEDLARAIHAEGQMYPGLGALLTKREAAKYIAFWREVFGASSRLEDLTPVRLDGKVRYVILIAGERRLRAVAKARAFAEKSLRFNGLYRITLREGISATQAFELQIQENLHKAVPPQDEARAVRDLYRWHQHQMKESGEKGITRAELGRRLGKNPDWISRALRFCALPESLQLLADKPVREGGIPFGMLVELSRFSEGLADLGHACSEEDLLRIGNQAILRRETVASFAKWVSARLEEKRSGQTSLFGSGEEVERHVRKTVAPHLLEGLHAFIGYFRIVLDLERQGVFRGENPLERFAEVQYSAESPARLTTRLLELMKETLPVLKRATKRDGHALLNAFDEEVVEEVLRTLEKNEALELLLEELSRENVGESQLNAAQ